MTAHISNNPAEFDLQLKDALSSYDLDATHKLTNKIRYPKLDHIPGGAGLPLLGHGLSMLWDIHKWLDKQQAKHGNVFRMSIPALDPGGSGAVVLLGPEANGMVLVNEGKHFSNYLAWYKNFTGLFDNNLLQRDFADHKTLRKILQSAFKREAIEGHMALLNPILQQGVLSWPQGQTIRSMDYVKALFLTAGSNVFLGVETGEDTDKINQAFTDIVSATTDLLRKESLWLSPYAKGVKAKKYLSEFIIKNIPARRKTLSPDLLSHFCHLQDENSNPFSEATICDQILFVLFAAHDTTTSTMSSVLYALASDLEWQSQLRQEIRALNTDELKFEHLERMHKADLTIREALRMYPPLALIPRFALKSFEYEGHTIPQYTPIVLSPLYSHYMEAYWQDPYQFDPYRFSKERAEDKQHTYQYIPFGGGAHKCLGLHFAQVQSKILLFHLLNHFEVTKHPNMKHYKYKNVPLTFPTDGLPLTFKRID